MSNVVGRLSREFARNEATFVYTFASPNYETEGEWNNGKSYGNFHYFTNNDDIVPDVPLRIPPAWFSKIGLEHLFNYGALETNQKKRFIRAYTYFRNMSFEEDRDLLGLKLRISELSDSEIDRYLVS